MTMRNNILIGLPRLVAVALTCQLPDWLNSLVTAGLAVVISLPSENLNTYTRSFRLQRRPVNNNSFYIHVCTGWSLFVHLYLLYLNVILTLALIWHLLLSNLILCPVHVRKFIRSHWTKWHKYTLLVYLP